MVVKRFKFDFCNILDKGFDFMKKLISIFILLFGMIHFFQASEVQNWGVFDKFQMPDENTVFSILYKKIKSEYHLNGAAPLIADKKLSQHDIYVILHRKAGFVDRTPPYRGDQVTVPLYDEVAKTVILYVLEHPQKPRSCLIQ